MDAIVPFCGSFVLLFGAGMLALLLAARRFAPAEERAPQPAAPPVHISYDTHYHTIQRDFTLADGVTEAEVDAYMRQRYAFTETPQVRLIGGMPTPDEEPGYYEGLEMPVNAWPTCPPANPATADFPIAKEAGGGEFNGGSAGGRVAWNRVDDTPEMIAAAQAGMSIRQLRLQFGIGDERARRLRAEYSTQEATDVTTT